MGSHLGPQHMGVGSGAAQSHPERGQGVVHRTDDGGRGGDDPSLTYAPESPEHLGGSLAEDHPQVGDVGGGGNGVVEQGGAQRLALLAVANLLEERDPEALGEASLVLPTTTAGLITTPQSTTEVASRTVAVPVAGSTSTATAVIAVV